MSANPTRLPGLALGLCAAIAVMAIAGRAHAAGYAVGQESVSGAGTAHAGGAAAAADATTIHSNPAGMTLLDGNQANFGAHFIAPFVDYDERASVLSNGNPVGGGEGGDGGQEALVGNAYATWVVSPRVTLGVGLTNPYGLVTKYEPLWLGRYSEVTTALKTFNLNPSAAVRLTDTLSLGVGVNVQYVRAKLLQAIDFGTSLGLGAGANDGYGIVKGDDVGFGYNVGVLYQPFDGTRLGLHYRSRINYTLDLDATFNVPAAARAVLNGAGLANAFIPTGASAKLTIPETASLSVHQRVAERWQVMADVTWTRWRQFRELRVNFDNATPTNLLQTQWNDVFRIAGGITYDWDDALTLRGGLAFDQSPIDNKFRGPGVPDSDRYVLALGAGYRLSDSLTLDVAYQHLFLRDAATRRQSATGSLLIGEFNVDVDILSAAVNWTF